MLVRSRSRNRARGGGSSLDNELLTLASYGASDAWDFVANQYIRGGVLAPSGLTVTRASSGYAQREDGIWVNFASGAARRTDKGLLVEGARTNRALHSRDLTQAAWTATNVTVARNQIGIDGTANSACSLTATAGNGTVLQAVTDASKARYFSVWIKRITGTGTVEVTLDNGSTWTAVTVTSAYTRVGATQTLANPTVGVRLVTDTDAVAIDFAQLEDGAFPSSPIATAGTAVTRASDNVTVTLSALTSGYSMYADWSDSQNLGGRVIDFGGSTLIRRSGGALRLNGANLENTTAISPTVSGKAAIAIDASTVRGAANGTSATMAGVYASSAQTAFRFGSTGLANYLDGYLRRVAVIQGALSSTQLQEITT